MPKQPASMIDICRDHAQSRGDRIAYRFSDGQKIFASLSFSELDQGARRVAAFLQTRCELGDRVLLLLESGSDFVSAFFGCMYAGVTAVPLNLPVGARRLEKIRAIARNCDARLMLTSAVSARSLEGEVLGFELVDFTALGEREDWADSPYHDPNVSGATHAFLQYTSGSTGTPKGVVVTHANLLANEEAIKTSCSHDEETVFVGWLPLFHDMGLVGNVLQPAYVGIPSILMPPSAFVRRPLRWLQLISEYRGTTSGGPDFAYDVCVRRIDEAQLAGLDLSSWRIAFNGSEPIRARTLEAFSRKFASTGFSARAFYPVYGLAEATLFVTAPDAGTLMRARCVPASALEAGVIPAQDVPNEDGKQVRRLVSCGAPRGGQVIRIVHSETRATLGEREIGEIWLSGANVTRGYWNDPDLTEHTFGAHTSQGEGPFLRTGDLGFFDQGELYVTGRIKDLLIISGKNHYPQDVEHTAALCDEAFTGRPAACFLVHEQEREALVVVQEISKSFVARHGEASRAGLMRALKAKIRDAVAREHGLALKHVLLVPQGTLPMTTSGKIQRSYSRQLFLAGEFKEVWASSTAALGAVSEHPPIASPSEPDAWA